MKKKKSKKSKELSPEQKAGVLITDTPATWKRLEKVYGLTKSAYLHILNKQGNACAICRRLAKECKPRRNLAVDHDHKTNVIRGLLCFHCNHKLLGWYIRDDVEKVRRILSYLERKKDYGKIPETNS